MATIDTKLIIDNVKLWEAASKDKASLETAEGHKKIVIAEVSKNPKQLLRKLTQPQLIETAIPYLGTEDQVYQMGRNALGSNSEPAIREIVENMYGPNSIFGNIAVMQSSTILRESLEKEMSRREREYMEKSLGLDRKTRNIEKSKTIKFIAPKITTDEQKFNLGRRYEAVTLAKAA